jgi:MFS superfamily sulfate permease-like transporter
MRNWRPILTRIGTSNALDWDAPLFFANAELFRERVLAAIANSPTPARWVVVAAEPVTSIDVTAADAICELDDSLNATGVELRFAEMKDPVKDKMKRFGLFARFSEQTFFATLAKPCTPTALFITSNGKIGRIAVCRSRVTAYQLLISIRVTGVPHSFQTRPHS